MASLRKKDGSNYWFACFYLPDGTRTQRSTKIPINGVAGCDLPGLQRTLTATLGADVAITPKDGASAPDMDAREAKRLAQRIAAQFEDASRSARQTGYSEAQARKTIAAIYEIATREDLPRSNVRAFFTKWLRNVANEAEAATHTRYSVIVAQFLDFLGPRADADITRLTKREIADFRNELAGKVAPETVNLSIATLRTALKQAQRDGLLDKNEASDVSLLKCRDKKIRVGFTPEELSRLLAVADGEWRAMIALSRFTGMRIGDVTQLKWENVDLLKLRISYVAGKTGKAETALINKPLLPYIQELPSADNPSQPLFPRACADYQRGKDNGVVSKQFRKLLAEAGLAKVHIPQNTGTGSAGIRHTVSPLSFHSLRHNFVSGLVDKGASDAIASCLAGHKSVDVNRLYRHVDEATLRGFLDQQDPITKKVEACRTIERKP